MRKLFNFKRKRASENDYTVSMLPQNRYQVFFDVLGLNLKSLFLIGMVVFLFCIPMALISVFEQISLSGLLDKDLNTEQIANISFSYINTYELIRIPCFVILFAGLSGIVKLIRQYAWEENVMFSFDFLDGIRSNLRYMALMAIILGVASWVSVFCANQVSFVDNPVQSVVLLTPVLFLVLLVLPVILYMIVAASVYDVNFGMLIKISLLTYAKRPFRTLSAVICCAVSYIPLFFPNLICNIIGWFICPLITPIILLGWFLFSFDSFDAVINKQLYPSLVGRGVFSEESISEKDTDKP